MKVSKFLQTAKSQLFIWPPAGIQQARAARGGANSPQLCIRLAVVTWWRREAVRWKHTRLISRLAFIRGENRRRPPAALGHEFLKHGALIKPFAPNQISQV